MSKKYKLLKDLPGIPAGAVGEFNEVLHRIQFQGQEPLDCYSVYASDAERRKDWFHDMDTPEPEKADAGAQTSTVPGEVTIGELLAIREHFYHELGDYSQAIQRKTEKLLNARLGLKWTELPKFPAE